MAAGLPVVASNWNGYRDLVRHGIDGYLVPSRWASTAPAVSARLGWQQFSGIESFPVVAGALAQLVQLDADAAEKALVSLLASPRSFSGWVDPLQLEPMSCLQRMW